MYKSKDAQVESKTIYQISWFMYFIKQRDIYMLLTAYQDRKVHLMLIRVYAYMSCTI